MIKNVSEIQDMLLKQGEKENNPIFKGSYMMTSPGSSPQKLAELKNIFPNLPDSYIKFLGIYNFCGVNLGNFSLYPYSYNDPDIVSDFINAQEDSFFPKEFMIKHHLYQIGSLDCDIIAVTEGTNTKFKKGEILYIEEGDPLNPTDSQILKFAQDFEQFLLAAGNLHQLSTENQEDMDNMDEEELEEKLKEQFFVRLNNLNMSAEYQETWKKVIWGFPV